MSTIRVNTIQHSSANGGNMILHANGNVSMLTANSTLFIGNTSISNAGISVSGSAISPLGGMKNRLINGNFDFWQRGTSGFSLTSYSADRWVSSTNGTGSVYQSTFTIGQTEVPNNPTYYLSFNKTNTADYAYLAQRIEDVRTLNEQTATVSFYAKADATTTIGANIQQNFGSGGSNATTTAFTFSDNVVTTTWKKFTATITLPSITGKTIGTSSYIAFALLPASSSSSWTGTFHISQVQLEAGTVATPFEFRPYTTELALCQRYCYVKNTSNDWIGSGVWYSASAVVVGFPHPVPMRATPSISGSFTMTCYSTAASYSSNQPTLNTAGPLGMELYATMASGSTTAGFGTSCRMLTGPMIVSAEL